MRGVAVLRRPELESAVVELVEGPFDPDSAGLQVDVLSVESKHLAPPQRAPSGQRHRSPVLLGHGLCECRHLVDVGDASVGHPIGPTPSDPAGVLHDEVVEDGGVEDRFEQPIGVVG